MRAGRHQPAGSHLSTTGRASAPRPGRATAPNRFGPGGLAPEQIEQLQRTAGNRAVAGTLQRSAEQQEDTTSDPVQSTGATARTIVGQPHGGLRKMAPDKVQALFVRKKLVKRLLNGPVFNDAEMQDLKAQRPTWLAAIGTGEYAKAVAYAQASRYDDWLTLPPGKRLLIATVEWREGKGTTHKSPAYTLGRHLDLRGGAVAEDERGRVEGERDAQIRDAFVNTLDPPGLAADQIDDQAAVVNANANANAILARVFLILQNGLQLYEKSGAHLNLTNKDVARALAHGGRVNIRIPALQGDETGTELTDWLGVTDAGELKDPAVTRKFATHHMSVRGTGGKFKERGGKIAAVRNALTWGDKRVRLYGVDLAADGLGNRDFNGDVILPDGGHGHMLLVFTPPRRKRDGALEVGIETTKPHGKSPVGYRHNILSTEATANPESSTYGHKKDKLGDGKLADNQRYVDLSTMSPVSGDWMKFLQSLKTDWEQRLTATENDPAARRALHEDLVGPRQGRFSPSMQEDQP
ncbi:hypothetical protein GCM10027271_43660 [Saccharopolyspora gloriosae]|uniref:Novel toxin 11 domain-containing protein n=1 Tax=Saccharopolyspora gloriosae TaxID=455344 RepID=A0A840NFF9_9PSEU|nr:PE-PGRS family protein [Saccharopolyspora gloriosae]MBB5070334.1 hypothetical protein [Saccharopolyspora gloriosae]